MKCLFLYTTFILSLLLFSCSKTEFPQNTPQLVIDGYIDDGGFPVVMVTTSVAVSTESQEFSNLADHLLRWATVSINNGESEVFLTGKIDKEFFPPFIYTTSRMRGEAGRTYILKVEYENFIATATTTIPEKPQLDSIKVMPTDTDSLCRVSLCFTDDPNSKDYYKIFVRKGSHSKQWLSSYLGIVNDDILNGNSEIDVNQGQILTDTLDFTPFFSYNDSITIKFAKIDESSYSYWNDYENYTSFSRNPLFPISQNLHSNISGGLGCWYGCGATISYLILRDYAPANQMSAP